MNNEIIGGKKEMENLKRVVLKEEVMAITGEVIEALTLAQMIYWSQRVGDFDKFIKEENERITKNFVPTMENQKPELKEFYNGWIYKGAAELKDELMDITSEKTLNRKLDILVEKGYLDRRNNPNLKYDRKYQYRVNLSNILVAMIDKGYIMQDYKVDLNFLLEVLKTAKGQNVQCKGQIDGSIGQNDGLIGQNDGLIGQNDVSMPQNVGAIPEIIIDTIIDTTIEKEKEAISTSLLKEEWVKAKNLLKEQISEVSFNTWFENLTVHSYKDNTITFNAPNIFTKEIILTRFSDLIIKTFKIVNLDVNNIDFIIIE